MNRSLVSLAFAACGALVTSTSATAQGNGGLPPQARAVVQLPIKFDTTSVPLREMYDQSLPTVARGGRDFEPGRPLPIGHTNLSFVDPLAATSVGYSLARDVTARVYGRHAGRSQLSRGPARYDRRPRPQSLRAVGQPALLHLHVDPRRQQPDYGVQPRSRLPEEWQRRVAGLRRRLRDLQRRRPDRAVRPTRRPLDPDPVRGLQVPLHAVRGRLDDGRPDGHLQPLLVLLQQRLQRLSEDGRLAGRLLHQLQHVQSRPHLLGSKVCALERDKMLIGASARQICAQTSNSYGSLLPADVEGTALPAAGTPNYLFSITSSPLQFWKFAVNWTAGTGTLTGPTTVPGVAAFSRACSGGTCIPQPGTTQHARLAGRSLDVSPELPQPGHARGAAGQPLGLLGRRERGPVVRAQHRRRQPDCPAAGHLPARTRLPVDGQRCNGQDRRHCDRLQRLELRDPTEHRYAYRAPGDTLGTIGNETSILVGSGSQTGTLSRWGDYSTISVDPTDGCQMVFTTEYIPSNGSFNWSTYIYSMKLSTCI